MTTLRDYILDCRCPNCGLSMQKAAPKRVPWIYIVCENLALALLAFGLVVTITGHWAKGAFLVSLAIFLKTGWRST